MAQCWSVRKNGSDERCPAKALLNSDFCGRHARVKTPVRWVDNTARLESIIRVQSLVRRFLVLRRLRWAGPGALKRSICVNDEELVSFEDKGRVSPLEYFGWEESGKVWWMSQVSALQLFREELRPVNPYTKVEWSHDTRKRLRRILCYRLRSRQPTWHSPPAAGCQTQIYVRYICQSLAENGFEDLHPNHWNAMSNYHQIAFLEILARLLNGWALEPPSRSHRKLMASHAWRVFQSARMDPGLARWAVARCVNGLFLQDREVADVLFLVESARFQALTR